MLQNIRQNAQGTAAKIIVGLIIVSFSIFGIESILLGGGSSGVAEVNGEEISPQEVQQAVNNQKRRLIAMMGDNLDPAMLDDDRLAAAALQDLIGRKLLLQGAQEMGLSVSEAELGRQIAAMEQFRLNGAFDPELYKSLLANAGFTPSSFKATLREDIIVGQMRAGLAGSDFATPAELAVNARITAETRDLRYMTLPLADFLSPDAVTEQEIADYYADNPALFESPEAVVLDYIALSAEDFRQPVEEERLRSEYELEMASYAAGDRSRVSHILFEAVGDRPAAERLAEAQAALAAGRPFAEVAKEFSDDVGSAGSGGDLGYTFGDAFPPEMEEAIAELAPGELSGPVQTDAGTHLILVTDREAGEQPSFEEMRAELQDRIQLADANAELLRVVEDLRDAVFNAEGLDKPAAELGLTVQRSEAVTRGQAGGLFANPALRDAAFSEDVLEAGHNSDVIELAGGSWVVLRVHEYQPRTVRPLDEVRDEVRAAVAEARASEALTAAAETAVATLRSGTALEDYATAQGYEWQVEYGTRRDNPLAPRAVLDRAFELPAPAGESRVEYVTAPTGDVQVLELMAVEPGSLEALSELEQQQLRMQVSREYAGSVDAEFQSGLRERADISVL